MTVDLSIIIVNWNVRELLRDCLRGLYETARAPRRGPLAQDRLLRMDGYAIEVLVVDNASSDGSVAMLRERFPWVHCIASATNRGFTGGNNLGLRASRGRYALLLNPDTRLEAGAVVRMLDYMEAHPQVGALGPRLIYGDGSPQSSRRRFPTLAMALMESTLLEQWFPGNRWARRYRMADTPDDTIQRVDWLVGACLLVRREAWEQVGLLDEGFFMYSEELDWCRRMAAAGWQTVYYPRATVTHYEGQSSGQVVAERHIHFEASKIRYFHKHHGRARASLLRAFLTLTYLYRWGEEGLKYALGHKRDLRRRRLAAYGRVLRSGLREPRRDEPPAAEGAS